MSSIYTLNESFDYNGYFIPTFSLELGKVYKLVAPIGLDQEIFSKGSGVDFTLSGKLKIFLSNIPEAFGWRNAHSFLRKKLKSEEDVEYFFHTFNLPRDIKVRDIRGYLCMNLFNFEVNYLATDLLFLINIGYDNQGIDQLYSYIQHRRNEQKCLVIMEVIHPYSKLNRFALDDI